MMGSSQLDSEEARKQLEVKSVIMICNGKGAENK